MKRKNIICCLILLLCWSSAEAQLSRLKYMTVLQTACLRINNPVLTYNYKIALVEKGSNRASDSITGILAKSYGSYLDSNSVNVNLVSDGYFFKADRQQKAVIVCRIAAVQKQLGLKPEDIHTDLLTVPDSLLSQVADFEVEELQDVLVVTCTMKRPSSGLRDMVFRVNRKDNSLIDLKMTLDDLDRWGNPSGYSRIYFLNNFSNSVDTRRLGLSNYVILEHNNARLDNRFKSYTLNTFF